MSNEPVTAAQPFSLAPKPRRKGWTPQDLANQARGNVATQGGTGRLVPAPKPTARRCRKAVRWRAKALQSTPEAGYRGKPWRRADRPRDRRQAAYARILLGAS